MNTTVILTKIKSKELPMHVARILGVTDIEVSQKSETDLDCAGLKITTAKGTIRISAGAYGGEFNVHVTIPRKVQRLNFVAFGECITKDFDTIEELETFISENSISEAAIAEKIEVEI